MACPPNPAHLALLHDALDLVQNGLANKDLARDHIVVLVVGVVCIPKLQAPGRGQIMLLGVSPISWKDACKQRR